MFCPRHNIRKWVILFKAFQKLYNAFLNQKAKKKLYKLSFVNIFTCVFKSENEMCCEVKKELNSTLKLLEVFKKNTSLKVFFT
jgi:hypothetical protein